ncbi:unnamed protein product [Clonostachys byssicola]|uniref:NADH-cytochrome b5 reductase n=1 Tax=Clonostachys byssicola TaxID=160290 RepID=A0A9N9UCM0_9HYPO|nr:unnamed protein product [Clonostachys byssicola]
MSLLNSTSTWELGLSISILLLCAAITVLFSILKAKTPKPVLRPDSFLELSLSHKTQLSPNTALYRFDLPQPTDVLGIPIGQHVSVAAPIGSPPKDILRSYTPVSDDTSPGHVDLIIKSYPSGNVSKYVGQLAVGQTIKFRGPKGAFRYTPNMVREISMIAGGTGITPMYQIARSIVRGRANGDKTKVSLIYANVGPEDILLQDELNDLARKDGNFSVYYVLNKPPPGWAGGVGFVNQDMVKQNLATPADDVKLLICGPPPMVSAMKKIAESLGFASPRPVSKLEDQVFCF